VRGRASRGRSSSSSDSSQMRRLVETISLLGAGRTDSGVQRAASSTPASCRGGSCGNAHDATTRSPLPPGRSFTRRGRRSISGSGPPTRRAPERRGSRYPAAAPARAQAVRDSLDAAPKLRRAMVAPERSPLTREIEVDDAYIGGTATIPRGGSGPRADPDLHRPFTNWVMDVTRRSSLPA
jgi:hypothetical protein